MAFLRFDPVANPGNKTCRWLILSMRDGQQLGYVEYRPTWRKYVWGSLNNAIFDSGCTQEITNFLIAHKDDRQ
jgi:hypothetical protein